MSLPVLVVCLLVVLLLAAPAQGAQRRVEYSVAARGAGDAGMGEFRRIVTATLNDPRGWSLGGRVRFVERRRTAGSFRVTLAAPLFVSGFTGCSAYFSCASGFEVLINAARWRAATRTFPLESQLHAYRQMVINHEVGHALGFGHAGCVRRGRPAPVMQQQSRSLGGCLRNSWPLPSERAAYARRLGVRRAQVPPSLALGRRAGHVALGVAREEVRALLGEPLAEEEGFDRYPRLLVGYRDGRVTTVTTRAANDRSVGGLGVGTPARAVLSRYGDACRLAAQGLSTCVSARGGRATTFFLRDRRVVAVRVEVRMSN